MLTESHQARNSESKCCFSSSTNDVATLSPICCLKHSCTSEASRATQGSVSEQPSATRSTNLAASSDMIAVSHGPALTMSRAYPRLTPLYDATDPARKGLNQSRCGCQVWLWCGSMPQLTGSAAARRRTMVGMYGDACGFGTYDDGCRFPCGDAVFDRISPRHRLGSSPFRSSRSKPVAYKISASSEGSPRTLSMSGRADDDGVDARDRATSGGVEDERVDVDWAASIRSYDDGCWYGYAGLGARGVYDDDVYAFMFPMRSGKEAAYMRAMVEVERKKENGPLRPSS